MLIIVAFNTTIFGTLFTLFSKLCTEVAFLTSFGMLFGIENTFKNKILGEKRNAILAVHLYL